MCIISYLDKRQNCVVTKWTESLTKKNMIVIEKNSGEIEYLYEEALKILETDINTIYTTRYIRKKNNSFRRIDEPKEELKNYMNKVKKCFTKKFNFYFPECVSAYVEGRSIKETVLKHVDAYAVIKFDIKDFFGSCTLENIMESLEIIYPFCLIDSFILETIIKACMIYYDGHYRLPQGAPTSPLLSNLTMLPLDFWINDYMAKYGTSGKYSRYSDDLFFSFKIQANRVTYDNLYKFLDEKLVSYNFCLNKNKTRFLKTKHGDIWMLGLTVGKNIRIGSKKKQLVKAQIWTFLKDFKDGHIWSKKEVQQLQGTINYYKHIEPDFINSIIRKYQEKTNINYDESVKNILCT